ncbi:MAG: penicillin acylase family protein [bacterium]|nr:penicillin acylase family protein [bacterium]
MRLRILGYGVLVLVLLGLFCATGGFVWLRGGGRPVRDGEHSIPGLKARVAVRWDRWGVPHIAADSEQDLAAALGFLHANDRFTQMELGRRAAFGRLSEFLGESMLNVDVYFRTLRLGHVAQAMWENSGPRARRWFAAYATGVNAWLTERGADLPPGLRLLGVEPEPWEPAHSMAFALLMSRDLSFWNDRPEEKRFQWLREFGAVRVRELLGPEDLHLPEEILALAREGGAPSGQAESTSEAPAIGSNNWAVGGSRTASGRALLANDPHLGLHLPGTWYQVHMRSPEYQAAGMTLPGIPGVIIGRGPHLAWAFTNTMLDDHDLFFEILDDSGERYRRGDRWQPLVVEEETIRIRGGATHTVTVRSTDHGPLLEQDSQRGLPPRSLAWTAYENSNPLEALFGLVGAATAEEALAAIEGYVCPAQNLVVAFASGELLYTVLGRVPQRLRGDGLLPSPGWDTSYGWDGLRPRDTNPTVIAPADDLLVTANHDIRPPGYAHDLSAEFETGHRAARIREALEKRDDWDWESFAELQTDVVSLYAGDVLAALAGEYEGEARRAYEVLAGWDKAMDRRGPAALYALVERQLFAGIFGDEARATGVPPVNRRGPLLRLLRGEIDPIWFDDAGTPATETRHEVLSDVLAAAWRQGRERWGDDVAAWSYGELHQLTLRHRLDAVPVFGAWLRRGPFAVPGSATTVGLFTGSWQRDRQQVSVGPSMRWVVDWSRPELAFSVMPGGQSGHPADPHYDDQLSDFLAGRLHPAPYSEEAIRAATVAEMWFLPPQ